MSKETILVNTQFYENYNVGPNGFGETPSWKAKGGHTFSIEMDADLLMYSDTKAIFSKMLEMHNTIAERFEYIDYEIQWSKPSLLGYQADYIAANEALQIA
jgi:hypothetical protein